jgi:hypothetical protein
VLEDGFLRVFQYVPQIARQFLLCEQLLCIVAVVSYPLIFDAVDKREALGAIDDFTGNFNEGLRITLEII